MRRIRSHISGLGLFAGASVLALAACSDPARPATPAPEVPLQPAKPVATAPAQAAEPSPTAAVPSEPVAQPVAAPRLPAAPAAAPSPVPPTAAVPAPTPQDQGNGPVDLSITDALRTGIHQRADLSAEARTILIATRDGIVTLRGPVADEPERDAILSLAHSLEGVQRVEDHLEPVIR